MVTNTGMSAVVLVTHLLNADDLVIAPYNCYGGCYRAFDSLARQGRFRTRFSDFHDLVALRRECRLHRPRFLWVETPSNPLLRITDLRRGAVIARDAGLVEDLAWWANCVGSTASPFDCSQVLRGLRTLGGVESLVCHPATMTHAAMSEEARAIAGIGDGLLRLSVGIEAPPDLVRDLRRGLERAAGADSPQAIAGVG